MLTQTNSGKNVLESNAKNTVAKISNKFQSARDIAQSINAINNGMDGSAMNRVSTILSLASMAMG